LPVASINDVIIQGYCCGWNDGEKMEKRRREPEFIKKKTMVSGSIAAGCKNWIIAKLL